MWDFVRVLLRNGVADGGATTKEVSEKSPPGHLAYATLDVRLGFLWQAHDALDIVATFPHTADKRNCAVPVREFYAFGNSKSLVVSFTGGTKSHTKCATIAAEDNLSS
jgi:hypothetical protein